MTRIGLRRGPSGVSVELVGDLLVPTLLARDATGARVALVGARALLLAGDAVSIDVEVGSGCRLDLVDVAGTVAYHQRGGAPASWTVRVRVGAGGTLVWHGEPLVVADGADVLRDTEIDLAEDAVAVLRETLVLGRTGEDGGTLRTRTAVRHAGVPLLREDLDLRDPTIRRSPAVLGPHRYIDTVSLLGTRRGEAPAGVTALDLDGPGTLLRTLGTHVHDSALGPLWPRLCPNRTTRPSAVAAAGREDQAHGDEDDTGRERWEDEGEGAETEDDACGPAQGV